MNHRISDSLNGCLNGSLMRARYFVLSLDIINEEQLLE
jgi:hypothetical protein